TITEFVVIEDNKVIGFMSKADLFSIMGGRYGYSLNAKKNLRDIINKEFLCVNCDMTVNQVSKLAMQRPYEKLYNPIVVEKKGEYFGVVTIKDLLETCTKADIEKAMHANPLTGLPGNLLIEKEIQERIFGEKPYCITYYDIDNFKAYNDCYGFENGDLMLELLADVLKSCATKKEFIGHIGGDDFIVIADYEEGKPYCEKIVEEFTRKVITLYNDEDVINGCIISKNRNGVTDKFPLAGVSIAGVTSKGKNYESVAEFSLQIAKLKKEAKKCIGSSICFQ
ncbi:MAG: GGDEF domain-containing protein, partial [Anaerotignaceae bacterium]